MAAAKEEERARREVKELLSIESAKLIPVQLLDGRVGKLLEAEHPVGLELGGAAGEAEGGGEDLAGGLRRQRLLHSSSPHLAQQDVSHPHPAVGDASGGLKELVDLTQVCHLLERVLQHGQPPLLCARGPGRHKQAARGGERRDSHAVDHQHSSCVRSLLASHEVGRRRQRARPYRRGSKEGGGGRVGVRRAEAKLVEEGEILGRPLLAEEDELGCEGGALRRRDVACSSAGGETLGEKERSRASCARRLARDEQSESVPAGEEERVAEEEGEL
eukprot:765096-Hanusia_phi.AAC.2